MGKVKQPSKAALKRAQELLDKGATVHDVAEHVKGMTYDAAYALAHHDEHGTT